MEEYSPPKGKVTGSNPVRVTMAELTPLDRKIRSPFHEYLEKAERYLEEAKDFESAYGFSVEDRKQTLLLGSIAASLIALAKKQ